ncbi:MAG: VCBS domain-containing protein [Pseudomonadota bacterium]|nr:VCBS domain-containing protein [Pseudomonadota bacterium]
MPNNINLSEFFDSIRATLADIKNSTSTISDVDVVGTYIEEDGSDPTPDVSSINFVNGTTGADVPLEGTSGLDLVLARSGNDMLVGYGSIDILLGSDDVDTIDYSYLNSTENGIFIDLRSGIAVSKGGDIDLLSSIENAIGTVNDDVMLGNGLNNIFFGNGGSDIIDGRGGSKDVAQFAGKAEDYDIKTNEDGSVSITNGTGTTTLYNIELVQFGEGSEVGDIHLFSVTDGALVAHNDAIDVTETTGDDEAEVAATFNVLGNDDEIGETGGQVITQLAFKTAGGSIVNVDAVADSDGMLEVEGKYGTLLLNVETGEASYVYSEEANRLADGQEGVDTFVYQVVGGDKAEFKVTVTGSNDAPTIGGDLSLNFLPIVEWPGAEDEGYVHTRGGVFEINDPDTVVNPNNFEVQISEPNLSLASGAGEILEMPGDIHAALTAKDTNFLIWTFDQFDDQGRVTYSYKVQDKAIDFLAEGDVLTIDYTLKVQDKNDPDSFVERPITVTIIGTNDQPEILVEQSVLDFAVDEDVDADPQNIGELTGNIVVDDPDLGDTLYISVEGNGSPAYSEGDIPDGVDISSLLLAGNFNFTSGDALNNIFSVPKGPDGNVEFTYAYNGSAPLDWLADGETLTLTFDVKVSDRNWFPEGTDTTQITITITGTNDGPVFSGGVFDGVLEEANTPAQLETSGEVFFTDLDLSDTPEVTAQFTSVEPVAGSGFTLTPEQKVAFTNALTVQQSAGNANNGGATWTFAIAATALDFLAQGEQLEVKYLLTVTDDSGATDTREVTVVVTGTNDDPTISDADILGEVTESGVGEDGTDVATGLIVGMDVDIRDVLTYSASVVDGALGQFSIDEETGEWTYTIDQFNANVQALNEGDSVDEVYTVTVSDNNGGTVTTDVTITINGTNDAPTIEDYTGSFTVVHSNSNNDESSFNLLELLAANDVDDGETETLQIDEISGTLSLSIAGHQVTLDIADLEAAGLLNIGEADGSVTFTHNLERIMAQVMDQGETANISGTMTVVDVHDAVSNSAEFDIELSVDPDKTNTFGGDDWTTADGAGDIPEMLIPTFDGDGDGPLVV